MQVLRLAFTKLYLSWNSRLIILAQDGTWLLENMHHYCSIIVVVFISQFIELGIGALALVLEEKLRRFNIDILLFEREILVVIPNESFVRV